MESLLHHHRVVALELMPIVGNIAKPIHRVIGVPEGMEHGQRAIGRLSRASCVFRPWTYVSQRLNVNDLSTP